MRICANIPIAEGIQSIHGFFTILIEMSQCHGELPNNVAFTRYYILVIKYVIVNYLKHTTSATVNNNINDLLQIGNVKPRTNSKWRYCCHAIFSHVSYWISLYAGLHHHSTNETDHCHLMRWSYLTHACKGTVLTERVPTEEMTIRFGDGIVIMRG